MSKSASVGCAAFICWKHTANYRRVLIEKKTLTSSGVEACSIDNGHRVVAPFPAALKGNRAVIEGRVGVNYQAAVDGRREVGIKSRGTDEFSVDD